MDVQGFGGDYDYGDDDYDPDDDKELDELAEKEKQFFGDDYEGDFDGDNFESNKFGDNLDKEANFVEELEGGSIDNILKARSFDDKGSRNFNADPPSKIITRYNFKQDAEQNRYSGRNRIPKAAKAVFEKNYFQPYNKFEAPVHQYKYFVKEQSHHKQKSKEQTYPDVIALVDDKYIHDVMSQNPPKSTRSSTLRVPRLLSRYNKHH